MIYRIYLLVLGVICLSLASCQSKQDKQFYRLFNAIGIDTELLSKNKQIVIIPQYGCSRCIAQAKEAIHASADTIFIVTDHSKKEFQLTTGMKLDNLSNVYLDKEEWAAKHRLVENTPLIYSVTQGEIISCEPFQKKKEEESDLPKTLLTVNQTCVKWGTIPKNTEQKTTFILKNTGKEKLYIKELSLSCECIGASYKRQALSPGDTLHLHITFHAKESGDFIREIDIYGNFIHSPLTLELSGTVND